MLYRSKLSNIMLVWSAELVSILLVMPLRSRAWHNACTKPSFRVCNIPSLEQNMFHVCGMYFFPLLR